MSRVTTTISRWIGVLLLASACTSTGAFKPENIAEDVLCAAAIASENPAAILADCPAVLENAGETIQGVKAKRAQ